MGGDQRSRRVEAHADYLLGLNRREPDLTLLEICIRLERVRSEKVSRSMIGGWTTFSDHSHGTHRPAGQARTSRNGPDSRDIPANGPFPQGVATVGPAAEQPYGRVPDNYSMRA